jgi:peptidoglycan/LPS O-acetylase OafA/YrhL
MEPEIRKAPIRFYEIDLLRFLAAFSVVLYHYTYRGYAQGNYSPIVFPALGSFTQYGHLGVELFFIVSGYVVLLSVQQKTVRQFFISRVIRLYPAFWVACTLTFIVKRIWGTGAADLHMSPSLQGGLKQYVFNMTMLQEFFGIENMDGAYWSLTLEITFYFLISLLIGYKLIKHVNLCLAVWLAYVALPSSLQGGTIFYSLFFPSGAPFFAAGMLFYLLQQPRGRTWQRYALLLLAYLLAIRSVLNGMKGGDTFFHTTTSHSVAAIAITGFFGIFLLICFRKIDLSRHTWLAWLGALTYPLYLLHSDIGFIIFHRLGPFVNKYLLLSGLLIAMLLMAYLVHRFIEKPLSRPLGNKLAGWLARLDSINSTSNTKAAEI